MKKPAHAEQQQEEEEAEEEKQITRSCCVDVELMERELGCHVNKQEFVIYSNQFEVRRVDKELVKHAKLVADVRQKVAPNMSLAKTATENALYMIGNNRPWDMQYALLQQWSEEMAARLRTLCRDVGSLLAREK